LWELVRNEEEEGEETKEGGCLGGTGAEKQLEHTTPQLLLFVGVNLDQATVKHVREKRVVRRTDR